MAKVSLRNVVKQYGPVKAVDDLSIEIQDKEFAVRDGEADPVDRADARAVPVRVNLQQIGNDNLGHRAGGAPVNIGRGTG